MYDEGPSEEDLRRFGDDQSGYCPECGAEIWDDAPACPSCGTWIEGNTRSRTPEEREERARFTRVIVVLLAILLSGVIAFLMII